MTWSPHGFVDTHDAQERPLGDFQIHIEPSTLNGRRVGANGIRQVSLTTGTLFFDLKTPSTYIHCRIESTPR